MNSKNIPTKADLPSVGKLLKSTIIAITLAGIVLITCVLPAEYGIDPTGIGNVLGLAKMGEIKVSLAQENAADKALVTENRKPTNAKSSELVAPAVDETVEVQQKTLARTDQMTVTLIPNEGAEIKLKMKKGHLASYVWWTDNGRANFDVHADSKKHQISYHNYSKGSTDRKEDIIKAAFDGKHGWFWRNRTSKTMTITLQVEGEYSDITRDV